MWNALGLLFPAKCPVCDMVLERDGQGVCDGCWSRLPEVTEPCCRHCGKPIADVEEEYCMDCKSRDSILEQGTALWIYTDAMRKAMANFKYQGCLADGDFYGREILRRKGALLHHWNPGCIIPVPLYWRRRWFRGFNQAAYVAGFVGKHTGIPVWEDALLRIRSTRPQKGLNGRQRKENLKDAFAVNPRWLEKTAVCRSIVLIDDIYTYGATLEACGLALRNAGVEKIYFICLCTGSDC